MPQFKCTVCSLVRSSTRIPPDCPTKDSCDFIALESSDNPEHAIQSSGGSALLHDSSSLRVHPASVNLRSASLEQPGVSFAAALTMQLAGRTSEITNDVVLGRNGDLMPEVFRSYREVSRRHCQLSRSANNWWVTHISDSSPTRLNNEELCVHQPRALQEGANELVLGEILTIMLELRTVTRLQEEEGYPNPLARARSRNAGKLQHELSSDSKDPV